MAIGRVYISGTGVVLAVWIWLNDQLFEKCISKSRSAAL